MDLTLMIFICVWCLIALLNGCRVNNLQRDMKDLIEELKPLQQEYKDRLEAERVMVENLKKNHNLTLVNDTEDDPKQHYYYGKNETDKLGYDMDEIKQDKKEE